MMLIGVSGLVLSRFLGLETFGARLFFWVAYLSV
jgi:hypothetical protein